MRARKCRSDVEGAAVVKARSNKRKLTGASVSALGLGIGLATTVTPGDRDIVQGLVTFLEDRRVLFNPEYLEVVSQVDRSVEEIRRELTDALQQLGPASPATPPIRTMRAACRRYMDGPRQQFRHMNAYGMSRRDNDPGFFVALGELRSTFGAELKRLNDVFKPTMEPQLRELFPSPDLDS